MNPKVSISTGNRHIAVTRENDEVTIYLDGELEWIKVSFQDAHRLLAELRAELWPRPKVGGRYLFQWDIASHARHVVVVVRIAESGWVQIRSMWCKKWVSPSDWKSRSNEL